VLTETLVALTKKEIPLKEFARKPEILLAKISFAQAGALTRSATSKAP
jgi:hypothetical protein